MERHGIETNYSESISRGKLGGSFEILSDKDELNRLYWEKEQSLGDIATKLGVSPNTVRAWLKRHGLGSRSNAEATARGEDSPHWKGGVDYYGPNWERQRERRLEKDDYECVVCGLSDSEIKERGDKDGLHVHHIEKLRLFEGENGIDYERANRIENLITLCRTCHSRWEGIPLRPERINE